MNERIIDYLHGTLDADELAQFENELRRNAALRERVAQMRQLQRRVERDVRHELTRVTPPETMTFAAIAPRVRRRRIPQRLSYTFAAFAAVVVLLFAVVYSLPENSGQPIEGGFETVMPEFTPFAVTPTPNLTITQPTDSVNPSTIVTRTPQSADDNLLESTVPAGGNSIVTRTPVPTLER